MGDGADEERDLVRDEVGTRSDEAEAPPAQSGPPTVAWTIDLRSVARHFVQIPNGGMILQFTTAKPIGNGQAEMIAPAVRVAFTPEQWAQFQEQVAAAGARSRIVRASTMPLGGPTGRRG